MKKKLFIWILAAMAAGAAMGLSCGNVLFAGRPLASYIAPFGTVFIRLLQMSVAPIILFSLTAATAGMSPARLGKMGLKTAALYLGTGIAAALIALFFANFFPFKGTVLSVQLKGTSLPVLQETSFLDTLTGIVPTNPFAALASGNILQIIFFAVFFGAGLAFLRDSAKEEIRAAADLLYRGCAGLAEVMYRLVHGVMYYAPIGVFALMTDVFSQNGWEVLAPLAEFIGVVYLAFAVQFFVVYGLLLRYAGWSLSDFLNAARAPLTTALVTRSSSAALPVSLEAAEENLGIPRSVASFTLPLGATLNMDGVTIQQCISVFFIAGTVGLPLDFSQQISVLFVTVLASIGTAGIPSGAAVMLLAVLNSVGLSPADGSVIAAAYAMLLGIDAVMDMGQTGLNVAGDLVCAAVIAKTENKG